VDERPELGRLDVVLSVVEKRTVEEPTDDRLGPERFDVRVLLKLFWPVEPSLARNVLGRRELVPLCRGVDDEYILYFLPKKR